MTELPTSHLLKPPESASASALRLLPWSTPDGNPAYVRGAGGGFLSDLADEAEDHQLDAAEEALESTAVILNDPEAGSVELRSAVRRLRDSLSDTLQTAKRRGPRGASPIDAAAPLLIRRWTSDPRSVGQARYELRSTLRSWGLDGLVDTAELVLSELLTNAVRHARSSDEREIETRFERVGSAVRIEVHDAEDTGPVCHMPTDDAESGRGLGIVDALTGSRWGVNARHGVGKLLWAVVADSVDEEQHGFAV